MKKIAVIPARFASSRFPGKPLERILGKPMIQWVYERILRAPDLDAVYAATDDKRIYDCVQGFGGRVLMTSESHICGTERVNECRERLGLDDDDIILNIQGDEPLIRAEMAEELLGAFSDSGVYMATLKTRIVHEDEIVNPNVVKVVTDKNRNALLFSRHAIPFNRDKYEHTAYYKHVGMYGYKAGFLKKFSSMEKSYLERMESLEQLRALENGFAIRVIETRYQTTGVDTPEQLLETEKRLREEIDR